MNPEELTAYLMGFFDGEGMICIHANGQKSRSLTIRVGQKCRNPLDLFVARFGGYVAMMTRRGIPTLYVWFLNKRESQREFLKVAVGYLQVKKGEAEIALQFLDSKRLNRWDDADTKAEKRSEQEVLKKACSRIKRVVTLMEDTKGQYSFPVTMELVAPKKT